MRLVAFTRPDVYTSVTKPEVSFPYQRVVALWEADAPFGKYVGQHDTSGLDERVLELGPVLGSRLMTSFARICKGEEEVNCARFARDMLGMPSTTNEPTTSLASLPEVSRLAIGAVGVVGVDRFATHFIGHGMGNEALQVMSSGGELGFAPNETVLGFYARLSPGSKISLHQM